MKKSKEENKPVTTKQITDLVNELSSFLEEKMGITLCAKIIQEGANKPFWRISKGENSQGILCTIHFDQLKKEIDFWCTHENLTPGPYSEHREISSKIQELSEKLGLIVKDLNKPKKIR